MHTQHPVYPSSGAGKNFKDVINDILDPDDPLDVNWSSYSIVARVMLLQGLYPPSVAFWRFNCNDTDTAWKIAFWSTLLQTNRRVLSPFGGP
jgi:hypothetical protein